jgi:hypothetical protein
VQAGDTIKLRENSKAFATALAPKGLASALQGNFVGIVRMQKMKQWVIRSQVLNISNGICMDAVHRLNGSGGLFYTSGLMVT